MGEEASDSESSDDNAEVLIKKLEQAGLKASDAKPNQIVPDDK